MSKEKTNSRRNFISTAVKGSIVMGIGIHSGGAFMQAWAAPKMMAATAFKTGFDQQPLPYKYDALENIVDAMTMEIHYSKHAAGYSKNLKEAAAAENADMSKPLEAVLAKISGYSSKMRNNAGGHYNHEMFWQCMRPKTSENKPTGNLKLAIDKSFGSFDEFKKKFADAAKTRFGSGWAWLYVDADKKLMIGSTPNQDNTLMNISDIKGFPLLGIDVWEHAYYLKYQNKRADYIDNWWNVVNWDYVQQRFGQMD